MELNWIMFSKGRLKAQLLQTGVEHLSNTKTGLNYLLTDIFAVWMRGPLHQLFCFADLLQGCTANPYTALKAMKYIQFRKC